MEVIGREQAAVLVQTGDLAIGAGGDYLDVVGRNELAPVFAMGDASGRSLPAALRALTLKFVIRALLAAGHDLEEVAATANAAAPPEATVTETGSELITGAV